MSQSESDPPSKSVAPLKEDTLLGQVIDQKYRIDRIIGRGGMGVVYYGEHLLMGRPVAIKVLHQHLVEDEEFLKRFRQEAKVTSKLRHKNAVMTYDFGVYDSRPYLVMEYAPGRTLKDFIAEKGALSPEQLVPLLKQMTSALGEAHSIGIVHRDLKPENILLNEGDEGSLRILDFGIAKLLQSDPSTATLATRAGMFFGTPGYASPEQVLGKDLDARSDLYALGVILYECLSGKTPFTAPSVMELLMKHVNEPPRSLRDLLPKLTPAVDAVVLRCLAKDREKRFQNMGQLALAFEEAVKPAGGTGLNFPRLPVSSGGGLTRGKVALAIIALLTLLIYLASDDDKKHLTPAGETTTTVTTLASSTIKTLPSTTVSSMIQISTTVPVTATTWTQPTAPTETVTLTTRESTTVPSGQQPRSTEELYQEGYAFYTGKQYVEAVSVLSQVIERDPRHYKARLALGTCYLRLGRASEALDQYQQVVAIRPDYAPVHFEIACLHALSGRTVEAFEALAEAIRLDPRVKDWARSDPDLRSLRSHPRFQQLVASRQRTPRPQVPPRRTDPSDAFRRLGDEVRRIMRF